MKKIVEAFKKEERTQYVEFLVIPAFWFSAAAISVWFAGRGIEISTQVVTTAGYVLILPVLLLALHAYRYDEAQQAKKKDEREVMHNFIIADFAYKIAIFGLGIYLTFVAFDFILFGLLIVIAIARLWKRIELEEKA